MAAIDLFQPPGGRTDLNRLASNDWSQPASLFFEVTKHDTNELTYVTRGLYVGGAGTVEAVDVDGTAATFVGVPAGTILPIRAKKVMSTGTTATSIVALV